MADATEPSFPREGLKVSLGAGPVAMAGFLRIDIDPATKPDLVVDVRYLDQEPHSVSVLYASHVLEHLEPPPSQESWEFLTEILSRWRRCLSASGALYLAVPDLDSLADVLRGNPAPDVRLKNGSAQHLASRARRNSSAKRKPSPRSPGTTADQL